MGNYRELAASLPPDVIKVAESGVFGSVELEDYARAGADAVLVGEGVATAERHDLAVERLVEAGRRVKVSERRRWRSITARISAGSAAASCPRP